MDMRSEHFWLAIEAQAVPGFSFPRAVSFLLFPVHNFVASMLTEMRFGFEQGNEACQAEKTVFIRFTFSAPARDVSFAPPDYT